MTLLRRASAEALGTAFLLAAVVGSGIMGEGLAGGNAALALLANSIATGGALVALIVAAGPVSGAHLNPAVTLMLALQRDFPWRELPAYVLAQIAGALAGVLAAQAMFGLPLLEWSQKIRSGPAQVFSEFVATAGLLLLITSTQRHKTAGAAYAIAAYITGAYWFTASTSFANPAVTLARALTDTFSGIRPRDVAPFVAVQLATAALLGSLLRLPR